MDVISLQVLYYQSEWLVAARFWLSTTLSIKFARNSQIFSNTGYGNTFLDFK